MTPSGGRPDNRSLGTTVGASACFATLRQVAVGSNPGNWHLNATNYFGFKFFNEADSATHYAWGSMLRLQAVSALELDFQETLAAPRQTASGLAAFIPGYDPLPQSHPAAIASARQTACICAAVTDPTNCSRRAFSKVWT